MCIRDRYADSDQVSMQHPHTYIIHIFFRLFHFPFLNSVLLRASSAEPTQPRRPPVSFGERYTAGYPPGL